MYKKGENIKMFYKMGEKIGEGSFAEVRKVTSKKTGEELAVKIISKEALSEDDSLAIQNEVEIMSQMDHPNIVKLYEIFEDENSIQLIIEMMSGGELFDRIVDKEHYSEKEASDTIRPVVDALRYCHSMGIAHRDLKPENLLYASKDPTSRIKVSDFGLAKFFTQSLMTTACGTPGYVAPEVLAGRGYDNSVDYWSIGVILYILLCGFPPFYADTNKELFDIIKSGTFEFPSPYWDDISDLAKDLISKLLIVEPTKRMDCEQILNHAWILGEKTPRKILPKVTEKIREFHAKRKFRKIGMVALAAKKMEMLMKSRKAGGEEEKKE